MASYKAAFGSFLKKEDLQGREVAVVIERISLESIKNDEGTEKKLVAHFAGKDKGLVLNRTTCETLEAITGTDDTDRWGGVTVVLYEDPTVKFGPKTVGGIRIRGLQAPPPPQPASVTADDIPF